MRVRDHVKASSAMALALSPFIGKKAGLAWLSSIFIDVDHYIWWAARNRRIDPLAAVDDFTGYSGCMRCMTEKARPLHGVVPFTIFSVLAWRSRAFRPVLGGLLFHRALDAYSDYQWDRKFGLTMLRDGYTCQVCGAYESPLDVHSFHGPAVDEDSIDHMITVCPTCHAAMHEPDDPAALPSSFVHRLIGTLRRL